MEEPERLNFIVSDVDYFYLTARLEAYENDALVFEKDISEKIKS